MSKENSKYTFALLDKNLHNRADFSCGEESLDVYIRRQASQDVKRNAAVVYVLTEEKMPDAIVGYFTLASTGVYLSELAPDIAKHLPRYPILSATLLGHLAVDSRYQSQGHGKRLLRKALKISLEKSKEIASSMVVVDALHEEAKRFYETFDFLPLSGDLRLYIKMETVAAALNNPID